VPFAPKKSTHARITASFPKPRLPGFRGISPPLGQTTKNPSFRAKKNHCKTVVQLLYMVGETGFEPATSASQTQRSTKLSYSPSLVRAGTCVRNDSLASRNLIRFHFSPILPLSSSTKSPLPRDIPLPQPTPEPSHVPPQSPPLLIKQPPAIVSQILPSPQSEPPDKCSQSSWD
jgi:hypothetical protein